MRLECSNDLEGLGEDANVAIVAASEEVIGAGAYATQPIALATSARTHVDHVEA